MLYHYLQEIGSVFHRNISFIYFTPFSVYRRVGELQSKGKKNKHVGLPLRKERETGSLTSGAVGNNRKKAAGATTRLPLQRRVIHSIGPCGYILDDTCLLQKQ